MRTSRPRPFPAVLLALGLFGLGATGCAGGRLVNVRKVPQQGAITKSRQLLVKNFATRNTEYVGDGQGDQEVVDMKNASLAQQITSNLVNMLTADGFQVASYQGMDAVGDAAVIDGEIIESNRGSWALRGFVGFGAGSSHVLANVKIYPANNPAQTYADFTVESTRGGGGWGDAIPYDSQDIANAVRIYMRNEVK